MAEYQITLNDEQLRAFVKATEALSRICTGQIGIAIEQGWDLYSLGYDARSMVEEKCEDISIILSNGKIRKGSSFGIYSPEIDTYAAVSYNIHQVLRNQLWKDRRDEGIDVGHGVDSSVIICNGEDPIKIRRIS